MMLLTKANKKALPALRSQDGKGKAAIAHVKFFGGSDMSFYASEFDPNGGDGTGEFFGLWTNSHSAELCYVTMQQLREMKFPPFGLGIERDRHFRPTTLETCQTKKP
jgi:hypothetical protein